MDWILNQIPWVFSGIGVAIISYFILKAKSSQTIKTGKNTKNRQEGGKVQHIESGDDSENIQISG